MKTFLFRPLLLQSLVLVDGDFIMTESVAMLMFLTGENRVEDHWYLGNTRQGYMEYTEWKHINIRKEGSLFAFHKYLNSMITKIVDNTRVAAAENAG